MRLTRARVQNYRSVRDSGWFEVEPEKSILVGPNEAGKTAVMRALEHIRPGPIVKPLDLLRDYPRAGYDQVKRDATDPDEITVAEVEYSLDDEDRAAIRSISQAFENCGYYRSVTYGGVHHTLRDAPESPTVGELKDELRSLAAKADARVPAPAEGAEPDPKPSIQLNEILKALPDSRRLEGATSTPLREWVDTVAAPFLDRQNSEQTTALSEVRSALDVGESRKKVLEKLNSRAPVMVYFNNYTRVTPALHLGHLADMLDRGDIDQADQYNFGNACLLTLLGYSARALSDLGKVTEPEAGNAEAFDQYRRNLDERGYQLNAASLNLTREVLAVWQPSAEEANDYNITITADQQYLKVGVMDSLGQLVEIDQRSEGFQWLVSFFIVFFAQTSGALANSVLLLDEPGLSLHGLKQREFRTTLSKLATSNQLLFTTHSPFLVGPSELDLVRVVEMVDRAAGTKINSQVIASDPASLLPLQEALGYDLAQSLFAEERNLVTEGLTDFWYLDATAGLLREASVANLNEKIAIVPAGDAGKVVYFATILHAHHLKVAAMLDSDAAGDSAANQEVLVHQLGNKAILRTKDAYTGPVTTPEIEDLLRETLVGVARDSLGWDVSATAASQPSRPIVDVFKAEIQDFSKYRLSKAYVRWTRDHAAADLSPDERAQWKTLIDRVNQALR